MNGKQFDALSRVTARGASRRSIMCGLLGSAFGAAIGWPGASSVESSARAKRRGRKSRGRGGVLVCHSDEELRVPRYAVRAILRDGGKRGPCPSGNPPGGSAPPCTVCPTCIFPTIQAAVDAARTGDIIGLCPGTYRETIAIPARASLRGLVIVGAGSEAGDTIIDGDGFGPVVANPAEGPALVLQRLTITGGHAEQGGGILTTARSLTLIDVRVTGNRATLGGGGIFSSGTLELGATDVTNNTARNGGGIFSTGENTVVLRNDSTVSGNHATNTGGGIHNVGGTVTLEDAVVSGNTPNNCVGVAGC